MRERAKKLAENFGIIILMGILYCLFFSITKLEMKCPFHELTGFLCPGCGISRMLFSLFLLDFSSAFYYNAAFLILLPFWLAIVISYYYEYIKFGKAKIRIWHKIILVLSIIALVVFGILRNITEIGLHYSNTETQDFLSLLEANMDISGIINSISAQKELFFRLIFACFCGGIIGLERSIKRKDAGIKTHIILALGAALFMIVSQYAFTDLHLTDEYRADASRIASNIVTGVSFLCAGVIFVRGASVKGLTTATGIWTTAGIGMAAGAGMYAITFFSTCLIIIIQLLLANVSAKIETHYALEVELKIPNKVLVDDVVKGLSEITKSSANSIKLHKENDENSYKVSFNVQHAVKESELIQKISENEYVSKVSWTAL